MTSHPFNCNVVDSSWRTCLARGIAQLDPKYLDTLAASNEWLPGKDKIFNAFTLPLPKVNYVLFGESPYPRAESANGFAFWDNAVHDLWSESGLSKKVNRATSLRNIIKMLLLAEGLLDEQNLSQAAIAQLDKKNLVSRAEELFGNFIKHGILLLNATPVLNSKYPQQDAKEWFPFTQEVLNCLLQYNPTVELILFGRIANTIDHMLAGVQSKRLYAEHPYNLSFINNKNVLNFFKPLNLLKKDNKKRELKPNQRVLLIDQIS